MPATPLASAGMAPLQPSPTSEAPPNLQDPPIAWEGTASRLRMSPFLRLWRLRVEQGACRGTAHGSPLPAFPQPTKPAWYSGLLLALLWLLRLFLGSCCCCTPCARCLDPGPPPPPPGCACLAAAPPSALPCTLDLTPGAALTEEQVRALPVPRRDPYLSHVLEAVVKFLPTLLFYASPALAIAVITASEIYSYNTAYTFDILTCAVPALNLTASLGTCATVIERGGGCVKYPLSSSVWDKAGLIVYGYIIFAAVFGLGSFSLIYCLMARLRRWTIKLLPYHVYLVRARWLMTAIVLIFFTFSVMYVGMKVSLFFFFFFFC
jgi:hypothetical protein